MFEQCTVKSMTEEENERLWAELEEKKRLLDEAERQKVLLQRDSDRLAALVASLRKQDEPEMDSLEVDRQVNGNKPESSSGDL